MSEARKPDNAVPAPATIAVHQEGEPQEPLSSAGIFGYSLANLGNGMFYALNNFILPLFLEQFTKNNIIIGLLSSTDSIEGIVVQPVVGAASDRMRSRLGRRRPFMLVSIPLSALFILLTVAAGNLPSGIRLPGLVLAVFLFTVLFNVAYSPWQALQADITPVAQRGRVTAVATLFGLIGQAGLLLLPLNIPLKFTLSAVLLVVTTLITCALVKEPEHPPLMVAQGHLAEMREAIRGLQFLHQAGKALLALFFSGLGIGAVLPFLTLFVEKITHSTVQQSQQMPMVLMASSALTVLPFGKMTDSIGAKKVLVIGSVMLVVASLGGLWVTNLTQVAVLMAIAGIGNAAQSAARYPLLTEIVPAEEVGFYTGLQATAMSLAMPVTSVLTGALINSGGYRVIFAVCAVCVVISIGILSRIDLHKAVGEIAARNRQVGRTEVMSNE